MEERLFHGSECDTVIYVGSGHLEAFTRARLKLFIITLAESPPNVATGNYKSWYMQYQASLTKAAENELINLIRKNIFHPMDTQISPEGVILDPGTTRGTSQTGAKQPVNTVMELLFTAVFYATP